LIKHTADVHVQDQLGQTPLHRAASLGNTAFVKMLIEEGGAKINLRDGQGNSALHIAVNFIGLFDLFSTRLFNISNLAIIINFLNIR
jgi:ankyrin repeat protein